MRRIKSKKNNKKKLLIILLLVCSFTISFSYARYTSEFSSSDQVRVAKSGELTLVEKLNGEVENNNLDVANNYSHEIVSGGFIDKEVYIEFTNTEVSTYLFLVVDNVNWTYDNVSKKISVMNKNSSLLSFDIDTKWIFLEEVSNENKLVFYYLVDVNNNESDNEYEVMNQIDIGLITVNDKEIINNSSLKFNVYSIQKNDGINEMDAWNYLNL